MSDDELYATVESILDSLEIKSRKMFGGIGIFSEKIMFSLIYDGVLYFRSTDEIASGYARARESTVGSCLPNGILISTVFIR
jgi:TfoX/Sxy family transcriptional regulator of competence genes